MRCRIVRQATVARLGLLLAAVCLPDSAHAQPEPQNAGRSADCAGPAAFLAPGQSQTLVPAALQRFAVDLGDIERIEMELGGAASPSPPVEVCDLSGSPLATEVMPNGQSPNGKGGLTVRFTAPAAGRYILAIPASPGARTFILRAAHTPNINATPLIVGETVFARLAPQMPRAWSFEGKAGQWVRIAATSQSDTAIHLVGPGSDGKARLLGEDDDSEGLNPLIQRKLHVDGTYVVEVQSLGEESDDITLLVRELPPPPPPAPAVALRPGSAVTGSLASVADRALYDIAVRAGRTYKIEGSAEFDLALDLGLADPLEPASGALASGISVQRTVDLSRSGGEVVAFTAATDGHLLLRVRGMGVNEGGESFGLTLTETGR